MPDKVAVSTATAPTAAHTAAAAASTPSGGLTPAETSWLRANGFTRRSDGTWSNDQTGAVWTVAEARANIGRIHAGLPPAGAVPQGPESLTGPPTALSRNAQEAAAILGIQRSGDSWRVTRDLPYLNMIAGQNIPDDVLARAFELDPTLNQWAATPTLGEGAVFGLPNIAGLPGHLTGTPGSAETGDPGGARWMRHQVLGLPGPAGPVAGFTYDALTDPLGTLLGAGVAKVGGRALRWLGGKRLFRPLGWGIDAWDYAMETVDGLLSEAARRGGESLGLLRNRLKAALRSNGETVSDAQADELLASMAAMRGDTAEEILDGVIVDAPESFRGTLTRSRDDWIEGEVVLDELPAARPPWTPDPAASRVLNPAAQRSLGRGTPALPPPTNNRPAVSSGPMFGPPLAMDSGGPRAFQDQLGLDWTNLLRSDPWYPGGVNSVGLPDRAGFLMPSPYRDLMAGGNPRWTGADAFDPESLLPVPRGSTPLRLYGTDLERSRLGLPAAARGAAPPTEAGGPLARYMAEREPLEQAAGGALERFTGGAAGRAATRGAAAGRAATGATPARISRTAIGRGLLPSGPLGPPDAPLYRDTSLFEWPTDNAAAATGDASTLGGARDQTNWGALRQGIIDDYDARLAGLDRRHGNIIGGNSPLLDQIAADRAAYLASTEELRDRFGGDAYYNRMEAASSPYAVTNTDLLRTVTANEDKRLALGTDLRRGELEASRAAELRRLGQRQADVASSMAMAEQQREAEFQDWKRRLDYERSLDPAALNSAVLRSGPALAAHTLGEYPEAAAAFEGLLSGPYGSYVGAMERGIDDPGLAERLRENVVRSVLDQQLPPATGDAALAAIQKIEGQLSAQRGR